MFMVHTKVEWTYLLRSTGGGGKFKINKSNIKEKCCCGQPDKLHEKYEAMNISMDHICNTCKGKCYGMCT